MQANEILKLNKLRNRCHSQRQRQRKRVRARGRARARARASQSQSQESTFQRGFRWQTESLSHILFAFHLARLTVCFSGCSQYPVESESECILTINNILDMKSKKLKYWNHRYFDRWFEFKFKVKFANKYKGEINECNNMIILILRKQIDSLWYYYSQYKLQ